MATRQARGFIDAFQQAYGEGREDWNRAFRETRKANNQSENAPRWTEMMQNYPTGIRLGETLSPVREKLGLGKPDPKAALAREDIGLGRQPEGKGRRTGQVLGTLAADVTQDSTRSIYWLLNAIQATGNVIAEETIGRANPRLFGKSPIEVEVGKRGKKRTLNNRKDQQALQNLGYVDAVGKPTKGVSFDDDGTAMKRNFEPGDVASLMIPTGLAINAGIGLMNPIGGSEGYEAAVPNPENKKETSNAVLEVANKYFLGRTGNLLPYNEFVKERPDVSPGEYGAYKAFKYDKNIDLNPFDDGKVNPLPGGVVKATTDGIHGPEVQVLGKSLPLTTGITPFATALAGTVAGVRSKKPIARGLQYGLAGYAGGTAAGAIAEQIRRRAGSVSTDQLEGQS